MFDVFNGCCLDAHSAVSEYCHIVIVLLLLIVNLHFRLVFLKSLPIMHISRLDSASKVLSSDSLPCESM